MEKLRIIVGGFIGLFPTGGATWDYVQYPLGLKMLGHDVYYIEDTMYYPVFQKEGKAWDDASDCIRYLQHMMEKFGLQDKWAYRDVASGKCFGMTEEEVLKICKSADVFINVSCATFLREEYLAIPKRILIDSDPMFTQMQYAVETSGSAESQNWTTKFMMDNHNYLFTFGENINATDCKIPQLGYNWRPTRQPVCLHLWQNSTGAASDAFTSIMNWSGRKKISYNQEEWGQKDVEFERFKTLPLQVQSSTLKVVINKPLNEDSSFYPEELEKLRWQILDPHTTVSDTESYRNFILESGGEFSVAKETYVKSNSGWFSGRSACYLAAGKPVITQETKWSKYIATGSGLFSFSDMDTAVAAIHEVEANREYHAAAAREMAAAYFDSNKVLSEMIEQISR